MLGSGVHLRNRNEPTHKKIKTFPQKMNAKVLIFSENTEFLHNFLLLVN